MWVFIAVAVAKRVMRFVDFGGEIPAYEIRGNFVLHQVLAVFFNNIYLW